MWMTLESTVLNDVSHRTTDYVIPGTERRTGVGGGVCSEGVMGTEIQFGKKRKFWRWWWRRLYNSVHVLTASEL